MLLNGNVVKFYLNGKSIGDDLLSRVADYLQLVEKEHFGFLHVDKHDKTLKWLYMDQRLIKQLSGSDHLCIFQVKFYPPEPARLKDEVTRSQMFLQIQHDIKKGKLTHFFVTYALLGAYLVQSKLGDYDSEKHGTSIDYLRDFDFAPEQSDELLDKIMFVHKDRLKGKTPAEAELQYLDNAKKTTMYGISLHHTTDSENKNIMLGVCSTGIVLYRDRICTNRFTWCTIKKIFHKWNTLNIQVQPREFEQVEPTKVFKLRDRRSAKKLWVRCK